ncbi:hypothetical protein B0H19DRAFT_1376112 [Mycena capillaripes]|nr:hypothetical protein B0H19DRAFT_1376112 [Mycena capillaripes]
MATADLRRRLAGLDAQIVEQKRVLRKLEQSRTAVERELHATATFSVLTLPVEITAEIFLHCLPILEDLAIRFHMISMISMFTSVCQAWREIALGTPALWSTLRVTDFLISTEVASKPGLVEGMIDRWLARTGTLPWSQLTKFEGQLWDWNLFILAPNLVEVKCDFEAIEDFPLVAICLPHLTSFTLIDGSNVAIFEYLNLPALKYLDISKMESYQYPLLEPFLARSSPPLVSLLVRGDDHCYAEWHRCLPRIANTLENLEIREIAEEVMARLFRPWDKMTNLDVLSNLRTLKRSDKLRSFRLVWTSSPFLDRTYRPGGFDVRRAAEAASSISDHLSRMASAGMEIYLGTEHKNYAAIDVNPAIEQNLS